jgi:YidC/Oxa1 family membrane protein insertase
MFKTLFYIPLYNALIGFTALFGGSVGIAIIALTLVVKIILSPLSYLSIKSQIEQKKLQPLITELRKKYPDKKEQSQKLMELYKEHKTNPFAGCFLILLQLPIIIGLYQVFLNGGVINAEMLYGFISLPETINTVFLGIDMGSKSIIFALIAGISQFFQMHWSPSMQKNKNEPKPDTNDMQAMLAHNMQTSMKYVLPVMIVVFAYAVPSAVALYWIISNLFMIIQEKLIQEKQIIKTSH